MSKFTKRIQKLSKKKLESAILVKIRDEHFEDVLETFKYVFLVGHDGDLPRRRNLIPVGDTNFISTLYEVDVIFINQGFDEGNLQFLQSLLRRTQPTIFLNTNFNIDQNFRNFFNRLRYEQVDVNDNYQVWKVIRR